MAAAAAFNGALGSKMDANTAGAIAGALGSMDAGTAKTVLASVVQSGGDKLNTLIGLGLLVYLVIVSIQSLLFSFQYAVYSLFAAGVLLVGELPFIVQFVPALATAASYLTPILKSYTYGVIGGGGVACFVYISWNPLLLAGHVGICYLAFRLWQAAAATLADGKGGYEPVGQEGV